MKALGDWISLWLDKPLIVYNLLGSRSDPCCGASVKVIRVLHPVQAANSYTAPLQYHCHCIWTHRDLWAEAVLLINSCQGDNSILVISLSTFRWGIICNLPHCLFYTIWWMGHGNILNANTMIYGTTTFLVVAVVVEMIILNNAMQALTTLAQLSLCLGHHKVNQLDRANNYCMWRLTEGGAFLTRMRKVRASTPKSFCSIPNSIYVYL